MEHLTQDIEYVEHLFEAFYPVGSCRSGGVTRLGYTEEEDAMHRIFRELGAEKGYESYEDQVGNTYVYERTSDKNSKYTLIASHLDSVVDGGRYDGVAGVMAGLLILNWARRDGVNLPIRVGAMRCEESSNFGRSTIGSGLITGEVYKHDIGAAVNRRQTSLREVFAERGYSLTPEKIQNLREYIELHIEQGRVLEEYGEEIGVVRTIVGPRRFQIHIHGCAEHSGATPMGMRADALCAAAEIILEIESIGKSESVHQSVATVGTIGNLPNALNVIPGEVEMGVDMRGIDPESLDRMEQQIKESCKRICGKRKLQYFREKTSDIPPIGMDPELQDRLVEAAGKLGLSHRRMISGAGHDAMSFTHICPTAMIFIPCRRGISHNKKEFASIEAICSGAKVIYQYLREEAL